MVVDGVPIHDENTGQTRSGVDGRDHGTGINDINPEDIESIEILKGAKAAVLYGSEGANGVMLITTKAGRNKGLGIDVGINHSWNMAAYYPEYQNEFGVGSSPGTAKLSDISKDGYYMLPDPKDPTKKVEALWKGASANFGGRLDGRPLLWWDDQYRPYVAQKNNLQDLFRTGGQTNVNVALSNSGELGNFRLSYNFRDYKGLSVGNTNDSHSFSFAANLKVNPYVKVGVNTQYTRTRDINAPYSIQDMASYGLPRELDVNLIRQQLYTPDGYNTFSNAALAQRAPGSSYVSEYYWSQLKDRSEYTRNHLIQSVNLDVKFSNLFSWTSLGGMDYTVADRETMQNVTKPLAEENKQGYYGIDNKRNTTFYAQTAFNYNQTFDEKWNVSAMIGGAVKRNLLEDQNQYVKEAFAVENWFSLNNTREDFGPRSERERGKDVLLSVYASAQLAYADQVFLELQGREDWSSILPPQNNHYFYPGVSLSWLFTETFKIPSMNFGKLRASWADVGRPGPRYFGNVDFTLGSYGGTPTMGIGDKLPPATFLPNGKGFPRPNLKPERKREYEIGFEASFLNGNRINVDFSYFHNNTYNQITNLPVPISSGMRTAAMNAGNIAQNGVELSINTKPIIAKGITWTLGVNLSHYKTKIKTLGKGIIQQTLWGGTGASIVAPIGGEFGEVRINPYKRDDKGNRIVDQETGVWAFDTSKEVKVGKITPDIIGGLTTGLTYKNFTLNAVFDCQFGATMVSQTNMYMLGNGTSKESLKYRDEARGGLPYYMNNNGERILLPNHQAAVPSDSFYPFILHDGVITPGVTPDGKPNEKLITAEQYYDKLYWQGYSALSEDQVYKSDYIAFRSLSLSYDLPKAWLHKAGIQGVKVNVFANNICYIYKAIPNVTPESTLGTNSYTEFSILPAVRSIGMGINLSF
jgi:iron complex outermembrane receptor protein